MPTEITRIDVASLAKWFAIAGGIYGLLWGVLAFVMMAGVAVMSMGTGMGGTGGFDTMGMGMGLVMWGLYVAVGVVTGGITGAILGLAYNLLVESVGGVVVSVEESP